MILTREDARILLGAIAAELESQQWRQIRREEYDRPLSYSTELALRDEDRRRAAALTAVRDKLLSQMKSRKETK